MSVLTAFDPPACQQDFGHDAELQQRLNVAWSTRVEGFTEQAIVGNPWNYAHASDQTSYFNALKTDIPAGTPAAAVTWNAFPGRLTQYLGQNATPPNPYGLSLEALLELADTGDGFREIPTNPCAATMWEGPTHIYGPYGPRGWMDEYCEWSVTRNSDDKITRVDFACENPEYWYTLWSISPERVAQLYQATLNAGAPAEEQITVTVEDLALPASGDRPLLYNPLNKWNSATVSVRGADPSGGAMHLTSTPNTLQTEINLAASATVQRTGGNSDASALICCSKYGQEYRHSDPHIGQQVNQFVATGHTVALANPSGLYIQMPDFTGYALPEDPNLPHGATAADCWQIVRGEQSLEDPVTGERFPGNFILHAAFALPQAWIDAGVAFTVGDIEIGGQRLRWAGQIAQTFEMALFARALTADPPQAEVCVDSSPAVQTPQPLQTFLRSTWDRYYDTAVPTPAGMPTMSLASNTVIVPPDVEQGATTELAVVYAPQSPGGPQLDAVAFLGDGVDVIALGAPTEVSYATPGNSYPGPAQVATVTVAVDADAAPGPYSIQLTGAGQQPGPPAPAFLNVVAPAGR